MCEQHVVYFNLFPTGIFGVFLVNDNKIVHQLPGQSQNLKKKKMVLIFSSVFMLWEKIWKLHIFGTFPML